jgi:hypothetical protein
MYAKNGQVRVTDFPHLQSANHNSKIKQNDILLHSNVDGHQIWSGQYEGQNNAPHKHTLSIKKR